MPSAKPNKGSLDGPTLTSTSRKNPGLLSLRSFWSLFRTRSFLGSWRLVRSGRPFGFCRLGLFVAGVSLPLGGFRAATALLGLRLILLRFGRRKDRQRRRGCCAFDAHFKGCHHIL